MNVIILAGGEGSRMGGVDKAAVRLDGRTLLTYLLESLGAREHRVIVVSPREIKGVATISEQPPLGGPVAGIAAGVQALPGDAEFTAVLAVDAPYSAEFLPTLVAAIGAADVAVTRAADGWIQPLCALWRTDSLRRVLGQIGDVRDRPAKSLLRVAGVVVEVPGDGTEADYDTVEELSALGDVELPPA